MKLDKSIILVRHGSTLANEQGFWQGRGENPLSEKGREEAAKTALCLKDENIDIIFHTPLKRTLETAELINRHHGVKLEAVDAFIEIDVGEYEGLHQDLIMSKYSDIYRQWVTDGEAKVPGGESFNQVFARVREGVTQIMASGYKNIVVVGHAIVNRAILGILLEMESMIARKFRMHNGAFSRILIYETPYGKHVVADSWNEAMHLR